ncbi:MAG: alpha-ketoglutarate-dependent dioxygenase AlkB [Alphaproteobacteria bacterium]|nr:alpha-ketoglutarate-dependent dioxygenase AlkB [Alphaproteobacteria bacterium]
MSTAQLSLLDDPRALPPGFAYRADLLSPAEESELLLRMQELPFKEFAFHGYFGKRRVVSFGLSYDFNERRARRADPIPAFLGPLRDRAAEYAGLAPAGIEHALVTEYTPGAAIGWHRDRPQFDDVIGISLAAACRFRFRRRLGTGWQRAAVVLEPRSVYLLRGPVRTDWEHSIPPAEQLRYSITFRSVSAPVTPASSAERR